MKSRSKAMLVGLLAAFALCAATAGSASAAQWYVGGKALVGSEKLAEKLKVETNLVFTIKSGSKVTGTLTCTEGSLYKGEIAAPASLKTNLELSGCKLSTQGQPECKMLGTQWGTLPLEGKLSLGTKSPEDSLELYPVTGTTWTESLRTEECSLFSEGNNPTKGTLTLKVPTGQTETVEQGLLGEGEASKGLYGWNTSEPWYLTGSVKLKLASAKAFSFH
jgi:hypothetical protein